MLPVFSIDGTSSFALGRFVNDSKYGNCKMKTVMFSGHPHLCLFAVSEIGSGEQLLYDYGDHTGNLFWRDKVCVYFKNDIKFYSCEFYYSSRGIVYPNTVMDTSGAHCLSNAICIEWDRI